MILVVGLSPAWQRTLEFSKFHTGEVNRTRRVTETASGKGVNVARVAKQLGARVRLLTVAGGDCGDRLEQSLKKQGITSRVIGVAAETRICQTLLSSDGATELVEEARQLGKREIARVVAAYKEELTTAKLVVLTGSLPHNCGEDFYASLTRLARRAGVRVVVDAQGKLLLNAIRARPYAIRVHREELAIVTGFPPRPRVGFKVALKAARKAGVEWVVVSDGPNNVFIEGNDGGWTVRPPNMAAVNPIGSGDAMLAGIAHALVSGKSILEAVRMGVACGAANALTNQPGFVRSADVQRLLPRGPARGGY